MASGGNTYEKYETKRRIDGKLCLKDLTHDSACRLLAEGEDKADIPTLLDGQISLEQIEEQLLTWQWQRRISWLKKQAERDAYEPQSADECLKFVKQRLVNLSKNGDGDKTKIDALKALASVAMDERKNGPQHSTASDINEAMSKLTAVGGDQ